jgi:sugar phosphate isomerase/epimerase
MGSLAYGAGFPVFELGLGNFGQEDPLWPRTYDAAKREKIRQSLSVFSCLIVRATVEGLNIASINPGRREESIRQYLECIEFAHRIGARIVSFHPGTQTWGFVSDPQEIVGRNVEFAERALDYAKGYALTLAFKTVGVSLPEMEAIVKRVGSDRFGVDLSIGAIATMGGVPANLDWLTGEMERWIATLAGKVVIVHLSGVHQRWHAERLDRCPFELNTCVDYGAVLRGLRRIEYVGPLVLEIKVASAPLVVQYCQTARDVLVLLDEGESH